jgi:hypothetical protein
LRPCHWVELDGTTILLDARRGEYLALGPEDSETWRRLITRPAPDQADAAAERLRLIAAEFGLLDAPPLPVPTRRAAHHPNLPRAGWCISRAALLLRLRGFLPAYHWAAASPAPARTAGISLQAALAVFLRAEFGFFSRLGARDCLPRSLALFSFLAGAGFAVRHVIGVQRYPFTAHAWVEHEGIKLLQVQDPDAVYTPIALLTA